MLRTIFCALLIAAVPAATIDGTFALQGGKAVTTAFLRATEIGNDPLDRHLDTWLTLPGSSTPIRSYDVDMTKKLHMIVVSDDFRTFLHVHPLLQADGHFLLDQRLPRAALYHVYSDTLPAGLGKQVFRFDLDAGGAPPAGARDLSERGTKSVAGPYVVALSTDVLKAGGEAHLGIAITKNGAPAGDLHPYLGAAGHAVFLNSSDLTYVHAHPMPANASPTQPMKPMPDGAISPAKLVLHVELTEPGTYKLWLQFRGGSQLYVAPFVVTAQ